jgi:hypothetical protein
MDRDMWILSDMVVHQDAKTILEKYIDPEMLPVNKIFFNAIQKLYKEKGKVLWDDLYLDPNVFDLKDKQLKIGDLIGYVNTRLKKTMI